MDGDVTEEATSYEVTAERVARGVVLLDDYSSGWWRQLNVDTLDMRYYDRCVLGQLATIGDRLTYKGISFELELETDEALIEHGFDVVGGEGFTESYARLTDTWRNLVRGRQEDESKP